jgi:hypothetical protein
VVTITAGFASLRVAPDLTMDKLIAAADGALLRAKAQGRNRVEGDAPLVRPARVSAQRWQRFEPVIADPWFADRIPDFLSEAHAAARLLTQTDDLTFERTTTELRAKAARLGLRIIEDLVFDLERVRSDETALREVADELIQYVTHVQVVYRRAPDVANASIVLAGRVRAPTARSDRQA